MTEQEITELMDIVREKELCVFPSNQTLECCDCYLCHVDFCNQLRNNMK